MTGTSPRSRPAEAASEGQTARKGWRIASAQVLDWLLTTLLVLVSWGAVFSGPAPFDGIVQGLFVVVACWTAGAGIQSLCMLALGTTPGCWLFGVRPVVARPDPLRLARLQHPGWTGELARVGHRRVIPLQRTEPSRLATLLGWILIVLAAGFLIFPSRVGDMIAKALPAVADWHSAVADVIRSVPAGLVGGRDEGVLLAGPWVHPGTGAAIAFPSGWRQVERPPFDRNGSRTFAFVSDDRKLGVQLRVEREDAPTSLFEYVASVYELHGPGFVPIILGRTGELSYYAGERKRSAGKRVIRQVVRAWSVDSYVYYELYGAYPAGDEAGRRETERLLQALARAESPSGAPRALFE